MNTTLSPTEKEELAQSILALAQPMGTRLLVEVGDMARLVWLIVERERKAALHEQVLLNARQAFVARQCADSSCFQP